MKQNDNLLIIFVKYPEIGGAKRRLAKDIGEEKAIAIYRNIVEKVIGGTDSPNYQRAIFFSPLGKKRQFKDWLGDLWFYPQQGKDLGERMYNAFLSGFKMGYKRIVLIGSDTPDIDCGLVEKAFAAIADNDTVIGPSYDGGYYLIGLRYMIKDIFFGINWSTDRVFNDTIKRLKEKGISFFLLDKKVDVDDKKSLKYLDKNLKKEIV